MKEDIPVYSGASLEAIRNDVDRITSFGEDGMELENIMRLLKENLEPHLMRYEHRGFQSMFNMVPGQAAKMGASYALDWNQGVTNYQVSPGGVVLEETCCEALCQLFGLGKEAGATMMYAGTYANQQAMYMALHRKAEHEGFDLADKGLAGFDSPSRLKAVVSSESHFSVRQAIRMTGLGEQALATIGVDPDDRMDLDALKDTLAGHGKDVFYVHLTAGTTSTAAMDDLASVLKLCRDYDAWVHVDGAYGFAYKLLPELADFFQGIDRVDSVVWDPHKQFYVPIPNSVFFAKDKSDFNRMSVHGNYFNRAEDVPNPGLKSAPSTRPLSVLPLATTLLHRGLAGIRDDLRRPLNLVKEFHAWLQDQDDVRVLNTPTLGIICIQMVPEGLDQAGIGPLQESLYDRLLKDGRLSISKTVVRGEVALRFLVLARSVTLESLQDSIAYLRDLA